MVQPICRQFARNGTCSWGDRCRFSHSSGQQARSTQPARSRQLPRSRQAVAPEPEEALAAPSWNPYDSAYEEDYPSQSRVIVDFTSGSNFQNQLHEWKHSISWTSPHNISADHLEETLEGCKKLLDSKSASIQQDTIAELAHDVPLPGLGFIIAAAKLAVSELQRMLPLVLQVLTYPEVVESLVCEESVAAIYEALCGPDGQRGLLFFQNMLQVLSATGQDLEQTKQVREVMPSALDAFVRMTKLYPDATGTDEFREVAIRLKELGGDILAAPEYHMLSEAWKSLGTKKKDENSTSPESVRDIAEHLAEAHLDDERFKRHDNDFAHISRIQILPTAGEIDSSVPEYLPSKDPRTHHFSGAQGLLDRQFRLLREDTVGQLRDAVRQTLLKNTNATRANGDADRSQSIRFDAFRNAAITDSFFNKTLGLLQIVEFDQPRQFQGLSVATRRQAWSDSRHLSIGSIVCVAGDGHTVFFTVADRDPQDDDNSRRRTLQKPVEGDKPTNLYLDAKRAAIVLRPVTLTEQTLTQVFQQQSARSKPSSTLVEFPGLLLASFEHTLQALQQMSKSASLPFSYLLAPSTFDGENSATARPPCYTTKDSFEFDLTKIAHGTKMAFRPRETFDLASFAAASKLDESQSKAFIYALSNEFALIQGPPGTGKSFIGVKLIQALLHNKNATKVGPIICVCYTNHALDQILEHLILSGISQVIRIGGRSKSELLEQNNLRKLTDENGTENEVFRIRQANRALDRLAKDADPVLRSMMKNRSTDFKDVLGLCEEFQYQKHRFDVMQDEVSLRCLKQADVVGITTTGLARQVDLLRRLNSKVLLIEEAGEILEAHTLPAMLPSLEHVIAIGDHQQLRPQIANNGLSIENPRGKEYSLDVSLFERLICPEAGLPSQPFATLQTQRRMHPSISRLIRDTTYPGLSNGGAVTEYPEVTSMRHRLYWFDHKNPESSDGVSKVNNFEVEMAVELVTHLVEHGKYDAHRITVLTPYLAQMRRLQRGFAKRFEVEVGDKDKGELRAAGLYENQGRTRAPLGEGLRISTVDNYQGEEADIIVVSLVRSNKAGNVGFLRTPNRINVLLSRARHGMYLIGNATVARNVAMWKQVTDILEEDGAIGTTIPVVCPRHKVVVSVSNPRDFSRLVQKNGCNAACRR